MMTRSRTGRRRPRSPEPPPTPRKKTSTTSAAAAMPTATTAQPRACRQNPAVEAAPSDHSSKRPSTVSKKTRMAWVDEWINGDSEQKMNHDAPEVEDEEQLKDDDVVAGEEEEEAAVSSAPSSPLCEPYIPIEITGLGYDNETHMAYKQALEPARSKYNAKRARQNKLPTLDLDTPGCGMRLGFEGGDRKHIPADGAEARKAVNAAARFVLGVSASVGVKRIGRGTCFWIDWDEHEKTGIVLTTARLILTESILSIFGIEGHPDDVEEYADDAEDGHGGPVIDFDGNVVGMVDTQGTFVPSAILLKCFHLWRNYRCIPRPHLGLELCAISLLDISHIDKILHKCKIDTGLIVKEVSGGSYAEKIGIRVGDVIECSNGEDIRTIFELENMLLSICKEHFDRGNDLNSKVDVAIRLFHTRKGLRSVKTLSANLSERKEVVQRACYHITIGEGLLYSVPPDHV